MQREGGWVSTGWDRDPANTDIWVMGLEMEKNSQGIKHRKSDLGTILCSTNPVITCKHRHSWMMEQGPDKVP